MAIKQLKSKKFRQADFATKLRVPEGAEYVETSYKDEIITALESGKAVYVEGCNGRAFIWQEGNKFKADMFFESEATPQEFDSAEEAADWASDLCVTAGSGGLE